MFGHGSHLLSSKDLTREDLERIFEEAEKMLPYARKEKFGDILAGKVLATLFYEPSTRTRFSFEAAMIRLGGQVISNPEMVITSSAAKGESLKDTGETVSRFADVIAMRHFEAGAVAELAKGSSVPVLNAGDGSADHPTQGLLDAFTIWREFGSLDGLTIGMMGDLKYGRVPHSQYEILSKFGVKFVFIAADGLEMPDKYEGERVKDVSEVISDLDVLAVTRVQKERFDGGEFDYRVDSELLKSAKEKMIVIHPLPRVGELAEEVDADSRAKYFDQITNGVAVRMALLRIVCGYGE
ncbi:MAG: aspartate carbamoyltransferase catalytic subunit [Patescibacteria group bacterium]|nr:aspartate carbamoyltransferase catalytic subunit [Patescibacteria group bacterium]